MAIHSLQYTEQAPQRTILVAAIDAEQRSFLTGQLDADGHTVYDADHTAAVVAKLSWHPVDVLVLGELERPYQAPTLVRSVRAGEQQRVHPGLPVITLGAGDELTTLRAYESGSDHHLPAHAGYVLLRTVIGSLIRRVLEPSSVRHLYAGAIDVDLTARTVTVAGTPVHVSRLEFELLAKFAGEPVRGVQQARARPVHLARPAHQPADRRQPHRPPQDPPQRRRPQPRTLRRRPQPTPRRRSTPHPPVQLLRRLRRAHLDGLSAANAKKISVQGAVLLALEQRGRISLDEQTSQLPGATGLRALAVVMSQHGEDAMLAIYDKAAQLRPGRAVVDSTVNLAVHGLLTPPPAFDAPAGTEDHEAPPPTAGEKPAHVDDQEPDVDEDDDPLEDPEAVHKLHDRLIEIRKALDDLGAVTPELAATRGRQEAQRILTDLLEEIHELPHALAAAIASQHPE